MKTPPDYSAIAGRMRDAADKLRPDPKDPCADALNLAVYHLRAAASKLQGVAEYVAEREKP